MSVKDRIQNVSTSQWNNVLLIVLIGLVLFLLFRPSRGGNSELKAMREQLAQMAQENKDIQLRLKDIKEQKAFTDTTLALELEKHANTISSLELRLRSIRRQSRALESAISERLDQLKNAPGPEVLPAIDELKVVENEL